MALVGGRCYRTATQSVWHVAAPSVGSAPSPEPVEHRVAGVYRMAAHQIFSGAASEPVTARAAVRTDDRELSRDRQACCRLAEFGRLPDGRPGQCSAPAQLRLMTGSNEQVTLDEALSACASGSAL